MSTTHVPRATFKEVDDLYINILGPLHDEEWNPLVDEDGPEYDEAMQEFLCWLRAFGWTVKQWLSANRRMLRHLRWVAAQRGAA